MNTTFTVVRKETRAARFTGDQPNFLAGNSRLDAWLLERVSDQHVFLLIGATTPAEQARAWADKALQVAETLPQPIWTP